MIFIVYYRDMADPNDMWQPIESIGPTGTAVAANIKRLRDGLPFTELSSRLTDLGRPIPPLGLRKIESGGRRVDTDDLLALAVALGVSPITLLMPADVVMTTTVTATGVVDGKLSAKRLWNWLNASYALQGAVMAFYARALPSWERAELEKGMGPTMAGLMDLRGP
ncbi:helix-turn-helix transcriptional regulator [Mycolicibacterium sp. P9-64]|uniref:helix-turn-helix domain-containing protein n=1 Tax=Mycolicibacterium sp. P9-64 TaxID=2024612 RepID=UPI001A8FE10B|nr:helix-turn-helix transcriptional regulator [Mycolicibacterium sp. P9-64]